MNAKTAGGALSTREGTAEAWLLDDRENILVCVMKIETCRHHGVCCIPESYSTHYSELSGRLAVTTRPFQHQQHMAACKYCAEIPEPTNWQQKVTARKYCAEIWI